MGADLDTLTGPSAGRALRVEVEELPRWRRRLALVVAPERVREERQQVTRDYAKRLRLPGFRPGRAPADVVRQRFRTEIEDDVVRSLVQAAVRQAVREHGLEPIAPPVLRELDLEPDDTLRATAELEVRPRLELVRTGGFTVQRPPVSIDPGAVEHVLDRLREERALLRPVERPAARGDVVAFEVLPDTSGVEPRSYEILLGAGEADRRVEEQLEGALAGEERTIVVEEPAPSQQQAVSAGAAPAESPGAAATSAAAPGEGGGGAGSELSAPPAGTVQRRYLAQILGVKERILPALDDAFAAEVSAGATLAALQERIAGNLRDEASARAEQELRERIVEAISEANRVEVPEAMVETYVERMLHPETGPGEARRSGPQGHARAGHGHGHHTHGGGPDESDEGHAHDPRLLEILRPAAERSLRRHLIVEAVARAQGLEPTDEQVEAYLRERVAEGASVASARKALERKGQLDDLRHHLRAENVFAYLKDQSTIRPAEGSAATEPVG